MRDKREVYVCSRAFVSAVPRGGEPGMSVMAATMLRVPRISEFYGIVIAMY
jgi:hypothetical protein